MKNKFIIFLVLIILFVPAVSYAGSGWTTFTTAVKAQGDDVSSFHFNMQVYINDDSDVAPGWYEYTQFDLQTQDSYASRTFGIFNPYRQYYIKEENIPDGYKIESINCTFLYSSSVIPAGFFSYQSDGVIFTPINDTSPSSDYITCTFNNVKIPTKNPVLIAPGVTGTELFNVSEKLWADVDRMMINPGDAFLDPLAFNSDITPSDSSVHSTDVIKTETLLGATIFNYTDSLINEFENQGYIENQDLFTFPYDWRYGVSGKNADGLTNSDLLKNKIADILNQTGADKVDVIAHSLGGLIVKKYVADNSVNNYIGKAVFVGVPNTGSPKVVKALVQGDNFGVSFGPVGLNDAEMKKLSENMPVAYDLLPSQQYYNSAGSFVSKIDFGSGNNPIETDLDYQGFKDYLTQDYNLNSQALSNAENLHSNAFDNFDLRTAGVDLYSIDGCKTGTMTNFLQVNYIDIFGREITSFDRVDLKTGDGTVPIQSSTNLPIDQSKKYYALSSNHSKLLSADGSRQEIVNLISGSNLAVNSNLITQDASQCKLNGKAIEVFSPVDISVSDLSAEKLGLADGNVINNIPNADFMVLGEHKFVYLPAGQSYSVALQGTDAGIFTIKTKDIVNDEIVKTESFDNIPVTVDLTGMVNLSGLLSSPTTLTIKNTPASAPQTILPTSTTSTVPISINQCKHKGWKNFGGKFTNQKQCIDFVKGK